MSPARLLEHFDRLIDTPDAVPRLRRFILDLAVRGKLVEQDPEDEPAGYLLKRISAEKQRLMKSGEIRKEKPPPPIGNDEIHFDVPPTWSWSRLGDVAAYLQRGKSPKYSAGAGPLVVSQRCVQWDGLHLEWAKMITAESLADYEPIRFLRDGDLLWNSTGTGTIGRVIRLDKPDNRLVCDSHVTVVRCLGVDERFIRNWLKSDYVYGTIEGRAAGATNQVELTASIALKQVTPIPPLAEQQRIVMKVGELMALCDELEAAQTKREKRRDRLVAATLHGLNNGDATPTSGTPSTFEESARFYFNHLPRLTTRPEHIHQLRQTILNLAVRGKLVPQDPKDEPSSKLLIRLSWGKKEIIEELGLRQQPELVEERDQVVPFHAPAAWVWSVMDECFIVTGGIQKTPLRTPRNNAFPYVGVSNVLRGRLDLSEVKQFELKEGELDKLRLEPDDLLVVEGNGSASEVGRCARWTGEILDCVHQNHIIRCRAGDPAIARFTEIYLNSETGIEIMQALAVTSAGLYNLSVGKIRRIQIPIPPLAEQQRIVAKVDELMLLCEQLETQIVVTEATRSNCLETSIHVALSAI
jgi:type I restriction enzyme S subunit